MQKMQENSPLQANSIPILIAEQILSIKPMVIVYLLLLILGFLTMLKTQKRPPKHDRPQNHSSIHYFEPQMIRSTIEIKSTIQLSPSISLPKKENQDRSNIAAARYKQGQKYQEGVSLRDKIISKLQKETKSRRTASVISEVSADTKKIISTQRQAKECISSIRKMLTQQSPPNTSRRIKENLQTKRLLKKNRQIQRQQFQQRQLQMILQRRQKQQAAQVEKLQRQIKECTFKPRLTVYKKR